MKPYITLLAVLLTLGFASCTFMSQPAGKGQVIISAYVPQKGSRPDLSARSLGLKVSAGKPSHQGETARAARNLSAATDIDAIYYTVTRLSDNVEVDSGEVDLYSLSIELFLEPGVEYRVSIDVDITDAAPGTNVGVKRYGAQSDFVVSDYYDTYVNLVVHPSEVLVFDPASVASGTPSTISYLDPETSAVDTMDFYSAGLTVSPADRLFYGADADLFYFNKANNKVYRWNNTANKITPSDEILSGIDSFDIVDEVSEDTIVTLYAVCADPTYPDWLRAVGYDSFADAWYYFEIDVRNATPVVYRWADVTADLTAGLTGAVTIVPTGIAVDTIDSDVYITYYSTDGTEVRSGVFEYYGPYWVGSFPSDPAFVDETSPIFTDVVWDQGKVWVSSSPNTGLAGIPAETGRANFWQFDDYLNPLFLDVDAQSYDAGLPTLSTGVSSLILPNAFLGPIQGSLVYFRQTDFQGDGASFIASLDLDTNEVTNY